MDKKTHGKKKPEIGRDITYDDVCFVVSPIGKEGSESYNRFKEVLDYIIKPAIESSSVKLKVVRADDINRSGSFIKDILDYLYSSFIVIADLTNQNPNVFYELGVRHALSSRTVLIAQSIEDVPSDLREYRTIIYNTSAKGSQDFKKKLHKYIDEMKREPHRPDNPVLDRLPNIAENKQADLEAKISQLQEQLTTVLSKTCTKQETPKQKESVSLARRMDRIFNLLHAERQSFGNGNFTVKKGAETKSYSLETDQGNFKLYFLLEPDGTSINEYWYVSIDHNSRINIEEELADIRVLMERCSEGQNVDIKFVLVTDIDLSNQALQIKNAFNKMKNYTKKGQRGSFTLQLFDKKGLEKNEKNLGIRIPV